jgi:hypothetical protein
MAQGATDQDGALASVLGGIWPAKSERGGSAGRIRVVAPDVLPAFVGRGARRQHAEAHTRFEPVT